MKDSGTSGVPLSHKTVAEPKIMVGKGNPYQGGNSICFFSFLRVFCSHDCMVQLDSKNKSLFF